MEIKEKLAILNKFKELEDEEGLDAAFYHLLKILLGTDVFSSIDDFYKGY